VNLARRWTSPSSATLRWLLGVLPWIVVVTAALIVWERGDRQDHDPPRHPAHQQRLSRIT